jgi:hypothetical protein
MSTHRRELLNTSDAPQDLSPDLQFLASRQASLAALILDHAERYTALYAATRENGPTAQTQRQALEAAGDLGTLLQSLRSREDLQVALVQAPGFVPTPLLALDQLFFSFTLLANANANASGAGEELDAALTPASVAEILGSERVQEWLRGIGQAAPGQ